MFSQRFAAGLCCIVTMDLKVPCVIMFTFTVSHQNAVCGSLRLKVCCVHFPPHKTFEKPIL